MAWYNNAIMYWEDGATYKKVTDHNRGPLNIDYEVIERKERMVDGTLRKYVVAKKRTWSCSWENLPSRNVTTNGISHGVVDNKGLEPALAGEDIENFYLNNTGAFNIKLRDGRGGESMELLVMISDFSKEIVKRGPNVDLWNMSITLEEV